MPKTPSIILREELAKSGFELLDVYVFKDFDVIRVLNKQTGAVLVHKTKRRVSTMVSKEDISQIINELTKKP